MLKKRIDRLSIDARTCGHEGEHLPSCPKLDGRQGKMLGC